MKATVAAIALFIGVSGSSFAATNAPVAEATMTMDALRQQIKTDERGFIGRTLELTAAEAQQFWPLYDRYHGELDRIIGRQNRAVIEYVQAEPTLTNANAKRIAVEMLKADSEELRLRDKQLKRALAVLPAKKAVRYIQLETRIRTLARYDVAGRQSLVQ